MFALILAIAVTATIPAKARAVPSARVACMVTPSRCAGADVDDSPYRIGDYDRVSQDMKMDAYRIDTRPCRRLGSVKCPSRGREIFRTGEPVGVTLERSFGL